MPDPINNPLSYEQITAQLDADLFAEFGIHLPNPPNSETVGNIVSQVSADLALRQRILDWLEMLQ